MDAAQTHVFRATLEAASAEIGVPLTSEQVEACTRYADVLLMTNKHINLTRIVGPAEVAIKHFADSLTLFRALPNLPRNASLADVGTGAGFPGMVLKIVRPDLRVTLLDSTAKRLNFLHDVAALLKLRDLEFVHARAEEAGRNSVYRGAYTVVTARAVAALPTLLEWCGPLVAPGGHFVAMKGASADEELAQSGNADVLLGLIQVDDLALTLPPVPSDTEPAQRRLIIYEKRKPTPAHYPRLSAEIKAKPLGY